MPSFPPHPLLIGIDVDGVLADLVGPLLDTLHNRSGVRVLPQQIVRFDLSITLGPLWPLAHEILLTPGFASSLPMTDGAVAAIEQLRELGRVVFVTTPMPHSPSWVEDRSGWLSKHFNAHRHDILHAFDKTLFAGHVLIDDAPDHLHAWQQTGRLALRMSQPWNQQAPGVVVHSCAEIVEVIKNLRPQTFVPSASEIASPIATTALR